MGKYTEMFQRSIEDPNAFWGEASRAIDWSKPPQQILDASDPPFSRWFVGGRLNTCYNAVDRHVDAGHGDRLALVYDSPVTGTTATYSYAALRDEVARLAGALSELGVVTGDRVVVYMPMVPQAVMAMLACARLGAIHSVVFGGFAAKELAIRIDDARPKLILAGSGGIEPSRVVAYKPLLDQALELATHQPEHCVIFMRPEAPASLLEGRDLEWAPLVAGAKPADCVDVDATAPLYVLYTSGTTGLPKGVVRDNGGHAVALRWSMEHLYDTGPGEVFWAASDVGWVVGHSYIVYAPLLTGCTTVLYEGKPVGTPDPGAFWRVIEQHGVKTLFTAPTAFRAIKKEDPKAAHLKRYDLSRFRYLFLAGERLDPDTYHWAKDTLNVPVIDHWWQTESGWPIACNPMGTEPLPPKAGSAAVPVPGWNVEVLGIDGTKTAPGETGSVVVKLPLAPGALPTLWNDDERFVSSYMSQFEGYYITGDGGYFDEDGYLWIMGRIDDVINVAGHRLSTGTIEEVLASHPDAAECAVIGVADSLKGQVPWGFVVLKSGIDRSPAEVERELIAMVREQVGPVASFKNVSVVARLPKTRSGKILRRTMRSIADAEPYTVPSTIEDAQVLEEIRAELARHQRKG